MMENPRTEKENIIKDKRNLFRLGKEIKAINDRILRDIKNLFDLKDIINNLKNSDMWRIQLTIANNFICSIDNDEEHVMHVITQKS